MDHVEQERGGRLFFKHGIERPPWSSQVFSVVNYAQIRRIKCKHMSRSKNIKTSLKETQNVVFTEGFQKHITHGEHILVTSLSLTIMASGQTLWVIFQ
jgi:hypothetical protein